jgi:hypothetical protein
VPSSVSTIGPIDQDRVLLHRLEKVVVGPFGIVQLQFA